MIDKNDPYDRAYRWAWEEGNMRDLVTLCYKTPDFAGNARRFHESGEFQAEAAMLLELGAGPDSSPRVLDFGCGNGVASYALARTGYQVTGIDSSKGLLAGLGAARKLSGLDGVQIQFLPQSGEKLPFQNETFDIVYIREVLHHIHALSDFLREVRRVLKTGGIVCCLRDVVIWNEKQREDFFAKHPLNFITQDEGCYYLDEYLLAFVEADLSLMRVLSPTESLINSYPTPCEPGTRHDYTAARQREAGYDLFSFFAKKA